MQVISSEDTGQSDTECLNGRERCLKVETEHLQVTSAKLHHLRMTQTNELSTDFSSEHTYTTGSLSNIICT